MDLYLKKQNKYVKATPSQVCEAASTYVFEEANKDRPTLASPKDAEAFLMLQSGLDHEQFGAVFLDTRQRVIKIRILSTGSVDVAAVHPREVVKACLDEGAAKVLLFHNHPSGVPTPSPQDIEMTKLLGQALGLFNIAIVDHMVIGGEKAVSMAERGLLQMKAAHKKFLDDLRASSKINMMAARPELQRRFGLMPNEARAILFEWMAECRRENNQPEDES